MNVKKEEENPTTSQVSWAARLQPKKSPYHDYEYPKVTVIIPTFNCEQLIGLTIKKIIAQRYPDFEIIVIDSGSKDRTLEVVKGLKDERIKVFSVSTYQQYEMINKGISQSSGEYINILFPGDYYLYSEVLSTIMRLALDHDKPFLAYSGTLLRFGRKEPEILYRVLNMTLLKKGQMPTSLQSCWFRRDLFQKIGKFDTTYSLRGGYDLLCRLMKYEGKSIVSINRVLTDYDLRILTPTLVMSHFWETGKLVQIHFGVLYYYRWLLKQKDIYRYFRLWWHGLKVAVLGVKN